MPNFDAFQYYIPADAHAQMVGLVRAHLFVDAAVELVRTEIVEHIENAPPRSGERYPIPGTGRTYIASAPGEPPAVREGLYIAAWKAAPAVQIGGSVVGFAYNDRRVGTNDEHLLGEILEWGTTRMAPRPHIRPALETVRPKIGDLAKQMSA